LIQVLKKALVPSLSAAGTTVALNALPTSYSAACGSFLSSGQPPQGISSNLKYFTRKQRGSLEIPETREHFMADNLRQLKTKIKKKIKNELVHALLHSFSHAFLTKEYQFTRADA